MTRIQKNTCSGTLAWRVALAKLNPEKVKAVRSQLKELERRDQIMGPEPVYSLSESTKWSRRISFGNDNGAGVVATAYRPSRPLTTNLTENQINPSRALYK